MQRPANSMVWLYHHIKNGHSAQAIIPVSGHSNCITLCIFSYPPLSRDLDIWRCSCSRLKHKLLCYPKSEGGTGLLDFEIYHASAVISQLLELFPCPLVKASAMSLVDFKICPLWIYEHCSGITMIHTDLFLHFHLH